MKTIIPFTITKNKSNDYTEHVLITFPFGISAAALIPQLDPPDMPLSEALKEKPQLTKNENE